MKAVICLLAIVAGANAGFLFGGQGGGYGPPPVPVTKIIKVIQAPVPIIRPVPIHVHILHQPQPIIAPAPVVKILKVIDQPYYSGNGWGGWD